MFRIAATLLLFAFIAINAFSQSYKFRKYVEQDGLNNRFVYTIDQDELGNLMIGTGEGLYTYDGFQFKEISEQQGLNDDFLTCSSKATDGGIWYGHNKGLITKYKQGSFEHFDLSAFTNSRINSIIEDSQQSLWVLTQNDGILKRLPNGEWKQFIKGIEEVTLYSFFIDPRQRVWLGTDMGLLKAHITKDDEVKYDFIDEIIETKVACITKSNQGILIGTEDSGIFHIHLNEEKYSIESLSYHEKDFSSISVNSMFEDIENNLWICSNNQGLIQLTGKIDGKYMKMTRYQDKTILKTASMKMCMSDREGNIWIGTMGDGLLRLTDNYFSIYTFEATGAKQNVTSVFEKNDTIWCGVDSKIYICHEDPNNVIDSLTAKHGLPEEEITSIYRTENGALWIGSQTGSLKVLEHGSQKFKSLQLGTETQNQRINDILGYLDATYIATDYGIYQFNQEKLVSHISIQSGLAHNVIKSLYRDSKGKIWIATNNSQITFIEDGIIQNIPAPLEDVLIQIRCFAEDNSGNMWIGTDGLGLMKITGDEIYVLNKQDGLYSDYCYSLICDHRNKLWVGHHGAMSQVNILNNHIEILDPGTGFDLDFNDNAAERTPAGIILFGINDGLLRYEPDKDLKNEQEPILHFSSILINDSLYSNNGQIELPYGEYKLAFDYIGVSLKNPGRVTYQYYLEGYENDWSEENAIKEKDYSKIGPGEYKFKVKCFNADGYGGVTILECRITIDKPFWLKWWFIITCILTAILTIRYIVLRRERYLRENQEKLKKALDERTKEVVEQKELLQEKNKDITDSIQYARNIQKAMLPPIDSLKNYFADAFVYYKPRDIVSGDFYWVERFDQTIVVSCADCTGHGVPGAFMSLIGSTLLKEVSSKKSVQSSQDVLVHLDDELRRMLNKQGEVAVEDGMDIVVFDYHIDTSILKMASANRPALLFHGGEWKEVKGDRRSVGGSQYNDNKEFTLFEYKISPGDMVYLFSDGMTDQFGGDEGKKLKRSGLYSWIKETAHLDMDTQRKTIKEKFGVWKGSKEQIDDIIIIGIKF
jgi:ligand-binding sensor domain-containing protein/serine phosphatase RsbU (regulator of sigma subunit)